MLLSPIAWCSGWHPVLDIEKVTEGKRIYPKVTKVKEARPSVSLVDVYSNILSLSLPLHRCFVGFINIFLKWLVKSPHIILLRWSWNYLRSHHTRDWNDKQCSFVMEKEKALDIDKGRSAIFNYIKSHPQASGFKLTGIYHCSYISGSAGCCWSGPGLGGAHACICAQLTGELEVGGPRLHLVLGRQSPGTTVLPRPCVFIVW